MPRSTRTTYAFNRGIVSPYAIARVDVERVALSAVKQTNWMPRSLGSMMLRPGMEFIRRRTGGQPRYIPFVFAIDDQALLELTSFSLVPLVDEAPLPINDVTATITNGTFDVNITGWTDDSDAGATISHASTFGGCMLLQGDRYSFAAATQLVAVGAFAGTRHSIEIRVARGPLTVRVGSTSGGQEFFEDQSLGTGLHVVSFTPSANFYLQFRSSSKVPVLLDQVAVLDTSGGVTDITLETPWNTDALAQLRYDQSGDVIFLSSRGKPPRKIIRRDAYSWSFELYEPYDGPFRGLNVAIATTITPDATEGFVALTASSDIFKATHAEAAGTPGALFRLESVGQRVTASLTGATQFSTAVRVTGVGDDRGWSFDLSGTFTARVTIQRSFGVEGNWVDWKSYTAPFSNDAFNDKLDNEIVYYRAGIKAGDYTSGTANVVLEFARGSITGVVQITSVFDARSAAGVVRKTLGSTQATENWYEGAWSAERGYPSAVRLYEGRLWFAGKDRNWGSVSDEFQSFDDTIEGDSGPIARSIGSGPVDTIYWMLGLQRLILGGAGAEHNVRSTSFDEPLTPTNYNIKPYSRQGSADVDAAEIDDNGVFVQRGARRLFELAPADSGYNYTANDLTVLAPDIAAAGIVQIGIQRKPDTRIHCVLADGTVAVLVYSKAENVNAWVRVELNTTYDQVKGVVVLPGSGIEDDVYYVVYTDPPGGVAAYCLVKWASEDECRGGLLNKQADFFRSYSGAAVTSLTGLTELEGREVVIWRDGAYHGTATVAGGAVSFPASTNVVVGTAYDAVYLSGKLGRETAAGSTLKSNKRVAAIGVILADTHRDGLYYGPSEDLLDPLPDIEEMENVTATHGADHVWETYDKDEFEFNGDWGIDSRVCLVAHAPKPCAVLALTMDIDEK